ncbi:MAG: hypothetical protein Kow0074_21260 [Candidatus Zixiibacteriota bacterium]
MGIGIGDEERRSSKRHSHAPKMIRQLTRTTVWVGLALAMLAMGVGLFTNTAHGQMAAGEPRGIIVKVRSGYLPVSPQQKASTRPPSEIVGDWVRSMGVSRVRTLWENPLSARRMLAAGRYEHPGERTFLMATETGESADDVVSRLEQLPWVEFAEVDRLFELHQSPNDPLYTRQWHLENTGQPFLSVARVEGPNNDSIVELNGTPGADVRFPSVYNHPGPKSSIRVCIIDTGLDTDHEDIVDRLLVNDGEIPDNGIDDDHNGFVDDVYGYDFSGDAYAATPLDIKPDSSVTDTIGHGTHVAGTVAATIDNGIGIAGVSDSARVFACKIFPYAYFSVSAQAIYYAVMRGARVINMSWGGAYPSQTLSDALQFAHDRGVVLIASMGNSGGDHVFYPSAYATTIGVGASTAFDRLATFSTYNDYVDVVAPGQDILSLRAASTDLYAGGDEPDVHIIDDMYYIASGTSMAAPHAAGVAAALLSLAPGLSNERIREILTTTADDIIDPYGDGANLPGYDRFTGWGRINMERAIGELPGLFVTIDDPEPSEWLSGTVTITGNALGASFTSYSVQVAEGHGQNAVDWQTIATGNTPVLDGVLATWNTSGLNGPYTIRLDAGADAVIDRPVYLAQTVTARIVSPADGDTVGLTEVIVGTAAGPGFDAYSLRAVGPLPNSIVYHIGQFSAPVWDDTLALWELDQLQPGRYRLRLELTAGTTILHDSVEVLVDDAFHDGFPATLPAHSSFAMTVVDIDGVDGEEIICPTERGIWVFAGDSANYPTWDPTTHWPNYPGWPRDTLSYYRTPPACADLDNDGKAEIIIATRTEMHVYSFIGEEYEGWPQPFNGFMNGFGGAVPTVGDLDGKPGLEIAAIDRTGQVRVWHENGEVFTPTEVDFAAIDMSRTLYSALPQAKIVDLNNDNRAELIAVGDEIHVFNGRTGHGFGSTGSPSLKVSHYSINGIAIGDFDNDLEREIAYVGSDGQTEPFFMNLIEPTGEVMPGWPRILEPLQNTHLLYSMTAGDIDGDWIPELFAAPYSLGGSSLYAFHADGTPVLSDSSDGLFAKFSGAISAIVLNDIDHDNKPELLMRVGQLIIGPDEIHALEPDATPVPGYPIIFGVGSSTTLAAPVLGDINRDGIADMVTLHSTGTRVAVWDLEEPAGHMGRPWKRYQADTWNSAVAQPPPYDMVYLGRLIDHLFFNTPAFPIYEHSDFDCSGTSDSVDLSLFIDYLFNNTPLPCVP